MARSLAGVPSPPAIAVHDVRLDYGAQRGVRDVSLTVGRGECFGFLGPNGAGKTTLIRVLLGLLTPQRGSVQVMGHDIAADRLTALHEVGYLPGELALFAGLSGRRTLQILGRLHPRPPARAQELCDLLGLSAADLRRPVRQYSRGMKQKLGLVAALQHDPPLAILDEPTGGLDPVVQWALLDWLRARVRDGATVFFSTHVLSEAEALCDRVGLVREGRVMGVHAVADLTLGGLRAVRVRFADPVDPAVFADVVTGTPTVDDEGRHHVFTADGDHARLLATLAGLPVRSVQITPLSLEDAVRHLYQRDDGPPA